MSVSTPPHSDARTTRPGGDARRPDGHREHVETRVEQDRPIRPPGAAQYATVGAVAALQLVWIAALVWAIVHFTL
jgi:hypothetical protein